MVSALALLATGVALTTLMHESWQLVLLWGVVVGAGAGAIANVLGIMMKAGETAREEALNGVSVKVATNFLDRKSVV